jgi:hypothetical protein
MENHGKGYLKSAGQKTWVCDGLLCVCEFLMFWEEQDKNSIRAAFAMITRRV